MFNPNLGIKILMGVVIFLLILFTSVYRVNAQSDTAVRSELIGLRNRVDRLETEIRSLAVRGENAPRSPNTQRPRSGTGVVNGEVVGRSDPLFERLSTLVIELKDQVKNLEKRVKILEQKN